MAIKLDRSSTTVVIWCTEHTFWRAMRFDMAEGHKSAENHELLYHPGEDNAHRAARQWRQRNAIRPHGDSEVCVSEQIDAYLSVLPDIFDPAPTDIAAASRR